MNRCSSLCLGVVAFLPLACGNTGAPAQDYGPLLDKVTDQVILPESQAFVTQADALVVAVQALSDAPEASSAEAARAAWRDARKAFRVLDALHFGPGYTQHITERIDVAPSDPAGIEALAAGTTPISDSTVSAAGGRKKGFLGLEYLLFSDPGSDGPAPTVADDDLAPRRRAVALGMAHEIAKSAHQLGDAWVPYAEQIKLAGAGGTQYATQRAAVDDLVGGCAYALESIVGIRLAQPLGRKSGGTPDPSLDFTPRSDNALADMQASLSGVFAVYSGDGLSSVIRKKSAGLDDSVSTEFASADAALAAIPSPFAGALIDPASLVLVKDAYTATQALKSSWNSDVSSALGATVLVGENDGD